MRPRFTATMLLLAVLAVPAGLSSQIPQQQQRVGVDERLGELVARDLTVTAADGRTVNLSEFIDRPTLLALVFYRCPDICMPLLLGLMHAIERAGTPPGEDYRVLVFSFNPDETPTDAGHAQTHIQGMFGLQWSQEDWLFAVADAETIRSFTESVGFYFRRIGDDFDHPAVLAALSPEGRIVRYLYGITFVPFDIRMALLEAAEGRVGVSVNRVLLYCFSYDPEGRTYVFNIVKVTGTLIIALALTLFAGLLVLNARRKAALAREAQG